MGRIIFHIGVAKTGTTSLQKNLFNCLKNVANLGYPNARNQVYQDFSYGIRKAEDSELEAYVAPFVHKVKEMSEAYPVVMISDEGLQGTGTYVYSYILSRLKAFFPDAEIMVTVRNQLKAVQSFYTYQGYRLKQVPAADTFNRKKQISFQEFLDYCIEAHDTTYLHYLKYKHLLKSIETHFPREKIHVLLFEEMAKEPAAFFAHMGQVLNKSAEELLAVWHSEGPKNTRQSARYLSYQKLRTMIPMKSISRFVPGLKWVLPKVENYLKKGTALVPEYTQQNLADFRRLYVDENSYLQNEYGLNIRKWGYPLPE